MARRIHINQDVVAGLMFVAFGTFILYFGRNYPVGTALRMGPGYLPQILGWLLVGLGSFVGIKGALKEGEALERWALRPLFMVAGAFLVFAQLIAGAGLIVTAILCVLIAAWGGQEFKWREQVTLAVGAALFSAIGFIHYLGLPMLYFPKFLGMGY